MSYPKKIIKVRPRRGIATDLPAWANELDTVDQGDNILFRLGMPERVPGSQTVYDPPSVAPLIILNTQISGQNFWLYQGSANSYVVETATHTEITHAAGLNSQSNISKLSLGLLNGVPFFNNALDEPMYWDGMLSSDFVDLPGWTATETCEFMVAHRFHLFAFGIDGPGGDFPNQLKWSDAAAPGNVPSSWTAAATNEAGDNTLSDTPGALVSAANLRNLLAIYKTGSMHAAEYVGGQEIFSFRTLFTQLGALARHSVADVNGRHFVVTDGDIVLTDGVNVQSIAQDRRKRYFFNSIDQNNFEKHFVVFHRAKNEVWLCFPESGSSVCTRAMIYDVAHNSWGDRELAGVAFAATGIVSDSAADDTWDADSNVWDSDITIWNQAGFEAATESLVLADSVTPEFREIGMGSETLTSTLAKYSMDFGDGSRFKFVKRVHLGIEGDTDIDFSFRIGSQQTVEDPIDWCTPETINSNDGFANVLCTGRFISFEITATTMKPFKISRLDIEAEMRGYH